MKSPRRSAEGFSLIELVIAGIVVASAGVLLVSGLVSSNRSAEQRMRQSVATQLLASQLALLPDLLSSDTPVEGSFEPPLEESVWTLEWAEVPGSPLVEATLGVLHKGQAVDVATYRPVEEP